MSPTVDVRGVRLIELHDRAVEDFRRRGLPSFEPRSLDAWSAEARPGVTVVDAGAYTGVYALVAARLGARAEAFEPSEEAAARLRANLAANAPLRGTVNLHTCALGRRPARGRLEPPRSAPALTSACRVVEDPRGAVPIVCLDDLAVPGPIAAVKVDVEGAEGAVLDGAVKVIERWRPLLIVEALTPQAEAHLRAALAPLGYRCERDGGRNLICRREEACP